MISKLILTILICNVNFLYAQEINQKKSYEIIWNTAAFESPSVYRDLNSEELLLIEEYRLADKVNIIYLNDVMSVKIFPKEENHLQKQ